jgi:hypothetical protein
LSFISRVFIFSTAVAYTAASVFKLFIHTI